MDISVTYPKHGCIEFRSQTLFADPDHEGCLEFVERVLLAEEVRSVTLEITKRRAEIHYCTRTASPEQAIRAIHGFLSNGSATNGHTTNGHTTNGKEAANGHAPANGNGAANGHASQHAQSQSNGSSGATEEATGNGQAAGGEQQATNGHAGNGHAGNGHARVNGKAAKKRLKLRPDARGVVRVFRHGSLISNWEIKHEIPGRMRLANEALHRKREICQAIESELMGALGVENYKTNPTTSTVLIVYNENQIRRDQVLEILQTALEHAEHDGQKDSHDLDFALCTLSVPLAAAAQFMVPALIPVSAGLFIYTSIPTFKEAYEVLFKERRLGVDVLDTIVVGACLATGSIFAGAVLCWCLSLGRLLVKKTQDNSKKMLLNVFGKQPRFVWLYKDGSEIEVALEQVEKGDIIVVNTGEAVPVDGVISEGLAMIDQHALTGESQPAEKGVGDKVFASTVLIAGRVLIEVEQAGSETASAKIAEILADTAGYKLSSQHKGEMMADRAVIPTLAMGTLGLVTMGPQGATAVLNSDFGTGIRMAAPLGMLSSLALCAQHGILVKDGRALELMNDVDTVLFDKTGTLTREIPEVGQVLTCGDVAPDDLLTYAAAAEHKMSHPIAKAILEKFKELDRSLPRIEDSKYTMGFGITVDVGGKKIRVGSARFMDMEGIEIPPHIRQVLDQAHEEGHSLVMVGVDDHLGAPSNCGPRAGRKSRASYRGYVNVA